MLTSSKNWFPSTSTYVNRIEYDASGANGLNGNNGIHGNNGLGYGGNGAPGGNGASATNGSHGQPIDVKLAIQDRAVTVSINHQSLQALKLGEASAQIFLRSVGGNGGIGGKGGQGGEGSRGSDGQNATQSSSGTSGGKGGDGAVGGAGGNGGNAGDGGKVRIFLHPSETDLLMLSNIPDVRSGQVGKGGNGGNGGKGGSGGSGGSSYSWTTLETMYTTDSDGNLQTMFYTSLHSNSGGSHGRSGNSKPKGQDGQDGKRGLDGTFTIHVENQIYTEPYDLKITHTTLEDANNDDVIEPNEHVKVHLSIKNITSMPTPLQPVLLNLQQTALIKPRGSSLNIPSLQPGEIYNGYLKFKVKKQDTRIGKPLLCTGDLLYQALLSRVNKKMQTLSSQMHSFAVRYPIEISPVIGTTSVNLDEEAIFAIRVHNVSKKALGVDTESLRTAYVKIEVKSSEAIQRSDVFFGTKDNIKILGTEEITHSVNNIKPNEKLVFSDSIQFSNKALLPYQKLHLVASLYIGGIGERKVQHVRCIQKQTFEIQLAEPYKPNANADLLLVINSETTKQEIEHWHSLTKKLGLILSIWNVSLYDGISFYLNKNRMADTALQGFQGKTVIFLNQPFYDGVNDTQCATEMLPSFELFQIARDLKIKTYVIGNSIKIEEQYRPSAEDVRKYAESIFIEKRVLKSSQANLEAFYKKIQKLNTKHKKQDPRFQYVMVENFNKQLVSKHLFVSKYQLGEVKLIQAPNCNQTYFLHLPVSNQAIHDSSFIYSEDNVYAVLKMLPFEKKLMLIQMLEQTDRSVLRQALLSDLMDEQFTFSKEKWTGQWSQEQLKENLTHLNTFINWDWSGILEDDQKCEWVLNCLIYFRRAVKKQVLVKDYLLPNRRQRILASATINLIDGFINKTLKIEKSRWKTLYHLEKQALSQIDRYDLRDLIRNPLKWPHFQKNSWVAENSLVSESVLHMTHETAHYSTVNRHKNSFITQNERLLALDRLEEQMRSI